MTIHQWDASRMGSLDRDAIRRMHASGETFRVSFFVYPSGTQFPGTMKPATCYVLRGWCRYTFLDACELQGGQWTMLPGGDYDFEVLGDTDVELGLVWDLRNLPSVE